MRKALAILVLLSMVTVPAFAGNVTDFEAGAKEAVADLEAPGCSDVVNISIPAKCHVRKALMNISSVLPDGTSSECPRNVSVLLNDTTLWEFNTSDFGPLGRQDAFVNNTTSWTGWLGTGGGTNGTKFRIPKRAVVQNATMELNITGPGTMVQKGKIYQPGEWARFGYSVAAAGDVNGDGYDDLVVGAKGNDSASPPSGAAYVYFGSENGSLDSSIRFSGAGSNDNFGISVSGAGDLNGDGYADIVVGAPLEDTTYADAGRAYVFFGGSSMDTTADIVLAGTGAGDNFGASVACAGDFNGDGIPDIVVGAARAGGGRGAAYVFFGGKNLNLTADLVLQGGMTGERFGSSADTAGDLNADGYADIIVGAPGSNRAYLFSGGRNPDGTADVMLGGGSGSSFGTSVSGAGDVNGDGYDDVIVGAPGTSSSYGAAHLFFGGANMDNTADVTLPGDVQTSYFGCSVSDVGDLNRDGYGDVLVGAYYSFPNYYGFVSYFFGGPAMNTKYGLRLYGESPTFYGWAVSGAGDLNGDGYDDVAVGAENSNDGGPKSGSAFIHLWVPGLEGANITVGNANVWSRPGRFNDTSKLGNLSKTLNDYLSKAIPSGMDSFGNAYVDVPVRASGMSDGKITISELNITYTFTATTSDFSDRLNGMIAAYRKENHAPGYITVPVRIVSTTPGKVRLHDLLLAIDESPRQTAPIPDFEIDEDTMVSDIIDVMQFFSDDYDSRDRLRLDLASATNSSVVKVELLGNQYVSVDAIEGPQNDNWTGIVEITVNCSDTWGSTSTSNLFRVIVRNVPDPPVITSLPPLNATAGQEYGYQVVAVDGDAGDILAYGLAKAPTNMTINSSSGLIKWIPSAGGKYNAKVSVTDGMFTAYQDISFKVPNRPPRMTSTTVPEAFIGVAFSYAIPAIDDDGDALLFKLLKKADGMTLDPGRGMLDYLPVSVGTFPVSVDISDGKSSIICDFNISVVQGNRAPKFLSGPVTAGIVGLQYVYNASASDADGDTLAFSLVTGPAGMTIDLSTGKIAWSPSGAGNFTVRARVSDGKGGEAFQEFTIVVWDRAKATVGFTTPAEAQKVKGRLAVAGKVTKGTLEVVCVQLRVDSGEWINVTGNPTWTYTLDTTKLKNGKHTLQARACEGTDYSDTVNRTVTVDNQKEAGKGFIPGFGGMMVLMAVASLFVLLGWSRKVNPCGACGEGGRE